MRRAALAVLLVPAAAAAHPIEPLVTGAPTPVPSGQLALGSSYSALHGSEATEQEVEVEAATGIGDRGELGFSGSIDAAAGTVGALEVGAKLLILMEGATGIDLALAGSAATDPSAQASVLAGRSLAPGFYLQGRVGVSGEPEAGVTGEAAAALQWAPIPRLLPTLEAAGRHGFRDHENELWIVPEVMWLLDINHLSIKVGVPIGLVGEVDVGVIAGVDWQG